MPKWSLYLLAAAAAALVSCTGQDDAPGSAPDASIPSACVDADGDGFGLGCGPGLDCDDADPLSTNECRSCAEHDTGCACDGSVAEETCYLDPVDVGGRPICHEGTRFCRDAAWTACTLLTPFELPGGGSSGGTSAALITGPVPCNPCNPSCYSTTDTPGPGDIGTNGIGVIYEPLPGGITLPGSVVMIGLVDTDGDGVPDAYDSQPMNPAVTGFAGGFFRVLPLGATAIDPLTLSIRIRTADIYILMDTTGSMAGEIANLRTAIATTVIPQVLVQIPDAWFGVGDLQEYPVDPYGYASNFPYLHRQDLTGSVAAAQAAVNALSNNGNITWPESSTQALYAMATGSGLGPYYPARTTCPAGRWGYPCFRDGTVPIVVLLTDAGYMNGPTNRDDYDPREFARYALPGPTAAAGNEVQASARAMGDLTTQSASFSGATCAMASDYSGSCGSGSGGDAVYSFTLTRRTYVVLDTEGSGYDTTLSLRNSAFAQLTCDDDSGSGSLSRIGTYLNAGAYFVIVDGWSNRCGSYRLNVAASYAPPTYAETIAALNARDIRVIVVESSEGYDRARADGDLLCTATGTVDPGGVPLRYSIAGDGTGLGATVVTAIRDLANYNRLDVTARANDNVATGGFDERTFVDSIVAVSYPAGRCTGITGGVRFNQCLPGTTLNFQVNFRGVVVATAVAQRFDFTIDVLGDGTNILSTVPVTIIVPPMAPSYPVSGAYFRDYDATASCTGTEVPRWRNLSWTATYPAGTSIVWTMRTAATAAALATATPVSFTTPAATSPQNVGNLLLAGGVPATLPHLRLTATLNANATRTSAPILSAFNVLFDCVPGE